MYYANYLQNYNHIETFINSMIPSHFNIPEAVCFYMEAYEYSSGIRHIAHIGWQDQVCVLDWLVNIDTEHQCVHIDISNTNGGEFISPPALEDMFMVLEELMNEELKEGQRGA